MSGIERSSGSRVEITVLRTSRPRAQRDQSTLTARSSAAWLRAVAAGTSLCPASGEAWLPEQAVLSEIIFADPALACGHPRRLKFPEHEHHGEQRALVHQTFRAGAMRGLPKGASRCADLLILSVIHVGS